MSEQISIVKARISLIQIQLNEVKAEFLDTILDQAIPLADRWELFINAPPKISRIITNVALI